MSMVLHPPNTNPIAPMAWRLHDAKARFSAIVDSAMRGTPQFVTRRGQDAVVVLAKQDYDALQARGAAIAPSFLDHLLGMPKSPSDGGSFEFQRTQLTMREVNFE